MATELEEKILKQLAQGKIPFIVYPEENNEKSLTEMLERNQTSVGEYMTFYLQYAEPEKSFQEIRKLQERINQVLGIHVNRKLLVAVNATEWLGHEGERYWEIFRKFTSDMHQFKGWKFLFYIEGKKKSQAMEMFTSLLQYLKSTLVEVKPMEKAAIADAILALDKQSILEQAAVEYLADRIFKKPALENQLELLVEDLIDNCSESIINLDFTKQHLAKPESLYRLLSKTTTSSKNKTKGGNKIGISL